MWRSGSGTHPARCAETVFGHVFVRTLCLSCWPRARRLWPGAGTCAPGFCANWPPLLLLPRLHRLPSPAGRVLVCFHSSLFLLPWQVYMTAAELMEAELKRRGGESTSTCCGAVVSFHTAAACWGLGADELPWLSPCLRFSCNSQDRSPPVATVLVTLHPTCRGRAQREQAHGGAAGGSGGGHRLAAVKR